MAIEAMDGLEQKAEDKLYTEHDIKTHADNGQESLRVYGNAIANILISNNPSGTRSELEILEQALASEDEVVLAELDPIIAGYKGMNKGLLNLIVPTQVAGAHLDLINVIEAVTNDIIAMREVFTDPLLSLIHI